MKKIILGIAAILGCALSFAQSIPEGRELFPVVYDFATDYENCWADAKIKTFDVQNNVYEVFGYTAQGKGLTRTRSDYTVSIKKEGSDFSVSITDYTVIACNSDGSPVKKATRRNASKSMANQLSGFIEKDLSERLSKWTDDEYQEKIDAVVTNPDFLGKLAESSSKLYTKKFTEKYNIAGKKIKMSVVLKSIDENHLKNDQILLASAKIAKTELPKEATYEYVAWGYIPNSPFASFIGDGSISIMADDNPEFKSSNIEIFSSNDVLIEKKTGDTIEISGTIEDLSYNDATGKVTSIKIFE